MCCSTSTQPTSMQHSPTSDAATAGCCSRRPSRASLTTKTWNRKQEAISALHRSQTGQCGDIGKLTSISNPLRSARADWSLARRALARRAGTTTIPSSRQLASSNSIHSLPSRHPRRLCARSVGCTTMPPQGFRKRAQARAPTLTRVEGGQEDAVPEGRRGGGREGG